MTLRYLEFDYSEDDEGTGTWDAMASVTEPHLPALHAEIAEVLGWAHTAFKDQHGPIEDGAAWDYDLQAVREVSTVQTLAFDETTHQLVASAGPPALPRHTVTLSISGTTAFCEEFRMRFGDE